MQRAARAWARQSAHWLSAHWLSAHRLSAHWLAAGGRGRMGELAQGSIFLFAGLHLDRRGLFRRDQRGDLDPVKVGGRALDLLGVLVERHGEVLSKAEIIAAVWP